MVWAALVVVAGGLTLWLQDSAEPEGPSGRERARQTPSLPEGWESACADATPDDEGRTLCFVRITR
ncbi:hypothetical protein [Streptomyces griseorubiginosus]|uniref:hypothetical protein n=1 Tax=Streptomyces griseorubiginosus TaxID=67304 RepID=UPI002E823962|nr:hypothetical protein [Streptomyces griseorubiginosus]WUB44393.1 hypothetical protein OHN19_14000 [Streptomyces griseorubiginosus]